MGKASKATAAGPDIRRKAIELLARREHTRTELGFKLQRKGFACDSIEQLLQDLVDENLLSSTRYIEDYIHSRIRRFHGPERIRIELENKGLDTAEIMQVLRETDTDWLEIARCCYARKYHGRAPCDGNERMKRRHYLYRRGFPREIIEQLVEQF